MKRILGMVITRMDTHEMYTGEQDRTLGNHVGWTLMKCILGNKTEH